MACRCGAILNGSPIPIATMVSAQPPDEVRKVWVVDPMAVTGPLPVPSQRQHKMETALAPTSAPARGVVRTALAIEPRDGRLWAFLPPTACIEDYIELTAAVEDTAS